MCVFPPGVYPPLYVSVWLALDDCDAVNGCLEVYARYNFLIVPHAIGRHSRDLIIVPQCAGPL